MIDKIESEVEITEIDQVDFHSIYDAKNVGVELPASRCFSYTIADLADNTFTATATVTVAFGLWSSRFGGSAGTCSGNVSICPTR